MNNSRRTQPHLAYEANQEHLQVLDEEQLEEVVGGGNCCGTPSGTSPRVPPGILKPNPGEKDLYPPERKVAFASEKSLKTVYTVPGKLQEGHLRTNNPRR